MPEPTTKERLRGLVMSAVELREKHPEWDDSFTSDYLDILENFITLSDLLDIEIDQKIEEISTDFLDGSIPFADSGFLTEDNSDLSWEKIAKTFFANNIKTNFQDFVLSPAPAVTEQEGRVSWNEFDHTQDIDTGLGPVLQVGQELFVLVWNGTGTTIDDRSSIYPVGAMSGRPSVDLANAETHVKISGVVLVTTMDIPDGTFGIATQFGKIRDVDTSMFNLGDTIWVSADTDGAITNVRPEFPDYAIQLGGVTIEDAVNGELAIDVVGRPIDTTVNFWNGVFRETMNFTVSSDGATITGSLEPDNGHDDMTMMFSDGLTLLQTTPPATITLTPGTDTIPQSNFVYVPEATKVLTVSTSDWPVGQHIKVSEIVLRTAATTETDGALRNQNWNDHIESTQTFQGHLSHITEKIRQSPAQWDSGVEGSAVIDTAPTPDDVFIKNTSGTVYQLHKQPFPILDMTQYSIDAVSTGNKTFTISDDGDLSSVFPDGRLISVHNSTGNDGMYTIDSTVFSSPDFIITVEETIPDATVDGTIGDDIHIVNDSISSYKTVLSLANENLDATGAAISNRSFSFVVWGVQNREGQTQHLMLNLPSGSYFKNQPTSAVEDANNFSVYSIPKQFQGVGFLIARFTFTLDAAGNLWSLFDTEDLRGSIPNTTAGGGAGGTGVTTFLGLTDTPSAYTGQAHNTPSVNAGESALEFTTIKDVNGGLVPSSMADATANNNTIYFSTDASKLVYKDSGGTVNALY